ncbi:MAG: hypothetical protein ACLP50_08035 [Solirubrobacteraceae bacterium]
MHAALLDEKTQPKPEQSVTLEIHQPVERAFVEGVRRPRPVSSHIPTRDEPTPPSQFEQEQQSASAAVDRRPRCQACLGLFVASYVILMVFGQIVAKPTLEASFR